MLKSKALFKDAYAAIEHAELPVFQQRWWLTIAVGSMCCREEKVIEDGLELGSLLYITGKSRIGMRLGYSPVWSHLGGPLVEKNLSEDRKKQVLDKLLAQLPRNIYFRFVCNPHSEDANLIKEAFGKAGFSHSTETTYSYPSNDPGVASRLNKKHRKHLRAAEKRLAVADMSAEGFIAFYEANLKAAGRNSYASLAIARDLIAAGLKRDPPQMRVFAAREKGVCGHEIIQDAAIACAWDQERYYLWMLTRRPASVKGLQGKPYPDAIKLLISKAVDHAKSLGLIFDVDGSNTPGSEKFYNEILKVPNIEFRDVYERAIGLTRLLKNLKFAVSWVKQFRVMSKSRRLATVLLMLLPVTAAPAEPTLTIFGNAAPETPVVPDAGTGQFHCR